MFFFQSFLVGTDEMILNICACKDSQIAYPVQSVSYSELESIE